MRWLCLDYRRIAVVAVSLLLGCGSTGGALVTLPFEAGGVARSPAGPMTIVSPTGWTITLTTALIALGPFYINHDPPDTQNFRNGTVIIEATGQVVVDALDPQLHDMPGGADGESGTAVAVEIGLFPPDATQPGTIRRALSGNVGLIEGSATRDGLTLVFSGPIVINQGLVTPTISLAGLERVNGADVQLNFTAGPQRLSLRVDPSGWFDQVDFGSLLSGSGTSSNNGVYTWDATSTFLNQLDQGVKELSGVYSFTVAAR
jgi:hypothetical protein